MKPSDRAAHCAPSPAASIACAARALVLGGSLLSGLPCYAEVWVSESSVQALLIATDNSRPGVAGARTSDVVLAVQPGLRVAAVGANLNLRFDASAAVLGSARNTIDSSAQPRVDAALGATLVPNLLFVDASVGVRQVEADPFGERVTDLASTNRRTSSEYRVAPLLRWRTGARSQLVARHEESLVTNASAAGNGSESADIRGQHSTLRLEREPVPLGASLEVDRDDSRTTGPMVDQHMTLEAGRAQLSYAFDAADLVLGVVAGRERGRSEVLYISDSLYGLALHWEPSARTELTARAEHRFFGVGGRVDLRWRSPGAALSLRAQREPATVSTGFGGASLATDATLLAASVANRPAGEGGEATVPVAPLAPSRSAGETALGRRGAGLPMPGVIDVAAGYPQLETGIDASWTLLGRRHSITLGVYQRTLNQITEGLNAAAAVLPSGDSRQKGGSVMVTRRLAPSLSASLAVSGSRIAGLGTRVGELTRERNISLTTADQLSPRTTFTAGIRYNRFRSTVSGTVPSEVTSLSIGLFHRF